VLVVGQTLSHYKIVEKLGSGGMGEVYVAEDTKLGRQVALKVLPPEMATGERLMRFEREAKAVAALDHPNIVTIYSVEEAEGVHFYTMQLVKGKTLTELLTRRGLPLNKLFEIAIPLADAVSAAHEKGIIHRDLKPDNLMVSEDARLKILDFGLAKLKQEFAQEGASEVPTQSATQEGRILGTVAYMSPEQAEGKSIDHRSDIFSMGIILYETATGERPFKGETTISILSSIVKDTPKSVTDINPDRPHILARIIRRCLAKDPTRRYQTALDLRNELEELKQDVESGEVLEGVSPSAPKRNWLLVVGLAALVLVAGGIGYLLRPVKVADETTRAPIEAALTQVTSKAGQELFPSLSPDGQFIIYASNASGNWDIIFQRVGGETALNLTQNSAVDDVQPSFSPDGKQIAFRSEREGGGIFLMGATGESVRRLTDFGFNPAWSPDGT
jgi:serine/threonine protein kinase